MLFHPQLHAAIREEVLIVRTDLEPAGQAFGINALGLRTRAAIRTVIAAASSAMQGQYISGFITARRPKVESRASVP